MNPIYSKYKERFIQISGRNRSLFLKNIVKKYSYDVGEIMAQRSDTDEFLDFLWHGKRTFTLMNEKIASKLTRTVSDEPAFSDEHDMPDDETVKTKKTFGKTPTLDRQMASLRYLKREVEELEKETGRYELYVGYPFVFGSIDQDTPIKAPLLLFPTVLSIESDEATLRLTPNQPIMLNKALILAYAKEHAISTEKLIQEFDPLGEDSFATAFDVLDYLNKHGFKFKYTKKKALQSYDLPLDYVPDGMEVKNMAVLGRFPLANSIYNDYLALEKDNLTTPSIEALLSSRKPEEETPRRKRLFKKAQKNTDDSFYEINDLDFTQENALSEIIKQNNIVIYGPPGTGKSQTIVNIISDALCKNKRVLVVSQKRAALDVVYNRLGKLNDKAMLIPDPEKDKIKFFERVRAMHAQTASVNFDENRLKHQKVELNINKEIETLQTISDTLFTKGSFGLTLQEMYAASHNIGKDTTDYKLYGKLKESPIIDRNYPELNDDLQLINDKKLTNLYFKHKELVKANQMAVHVRSNVDMHELRLAIDYLKTLITTDITPFDVSRFPHSRYFTTFYLENTANSRSTIKRVANIIMQIEHPSLSKWVTATAIPPLWVAFPFVKTSYDRLREDITIDLHIAKQNIDAFTADCKILERVLDKEGYALAVGGYINGNLDFMRKLLVALQNYIPIRDLNNEIQNLSEMVRDLLDFAYDNSDKTLESLQYVITKILSIRIYHELIQSAAYSEQMLSKTVTFDDLRNRIITLKANQREISKAVAMDSFSKVYADYFQQSEGSKDFLYEIQKQRALKPIRVMFELFDEYLLRLFPCWLLSPEVVSTILPLKRGLFDLVVFDEASQIFIESAIPSIYRADKVVVAGDNKQLRPTAGFVKRYFGDDSVSGLDLSTQAALEVESLLDLATARYSPVYLSYHYRSKYAELIDFSNAAFYENKLQIAPNICRSADEAPIERIKVKGVWHNRHNHEEAATIIKLLKTIFREREENESIGIVTFNIEQKEYIEDLMDEEAAKNKTFARQLNAEKNRVVDGENISLFVKNLENVQGDERDIIIFSIGYAKNDYDKVIAQFGSLSMEGGENRLNVAITRAKKKVYVVTSIEPEELDKSETAKNLGPKLLKNYLKYVRAISEHNEQDVKRLLTSMYTDNKNINPIGAYEQQIKAALEARGYEVDINLGNTDYKLSLGVYDKTLNRYILGIECDYQAFHASPYVLERDVYRIKFLEGRNWKVVRVWSRDWWLSPDKVLAELITAIEHQKAQITAEINKNK